MLAEYGITPQYPDRRSLDLNHIIQGTDTLPLSPPGSELSRKSFWITELFNNPDNPAMTAIPRAVRDWNIAVRRRHFEHSHGITQSMVVRKVFHSMNVNNKSYELISRSPEYNLNSAQVQVDADCHDAGRFPQAHFHTFNDAQTFDHAQVSAAMVQEARLPLDIYGCDEALALDVISQHSKPSCTDNAYFHILRDADKIIIANEYIADIEKLLSDGKIDRFSVEPEALEYFMSGRNIPNRLATYNPANRILQRIGWKDDLIFPAARKDFINEGIPQRLIGLLEQVTHADQQFVQQEVERWQREVMNEKSHFYNFLTIPV